MAASCVPTPADDRLVAPIYPFRGQMDTLLMIFSGFDAAQLTCWNAIWLTTGRQRPSELTKPAQGLDSTSQTSLRQSPTVTTTPCNLLVTYRCRALFAPFNYGKS